MHHLLCMQTEYGVFYNFMVEFAAPFFWGLLFASLTVVYCLLWRTHRNALEELREREPFFAVRSLLEEEVKGQTAQFSFLHEF